MRRLATLFLVMPLLGPSAVPTAAQSATTTEELLAGFVSEEVEPGVFRVVNDGVRDLRSGNPDGGNDILAGRDGSVWLFDWPNRSLRLGEEAEYGWSGSSLEYGIEVTSDGTLWRVGPAGSIGSLDGGAWTEHTPAINGDDGWDRSTLEVGTGGTVWALTADGYPDCSGANRAECVRTVLIRLDADGSVTTSEGWAGIYDGPVAEEQLAVSPGGEVWLMGDGEAQATGDVQELLRYDGQEWQLMEVPVGLRRVWAGQSFDIGPDGTLWAAVGDPSTQGDGLARLDGSGWTVFTEADGVRAWGFYGFIPTDHLHVAPDGSVWVNAEGEDSSCGGVANFDGTTWTGYLTDLCVHDLDIAPDGAVWVRAGTYEMRGGFEYWDPPDIYVINPEATPAE